MRKAYLIAAVLAIVTSCCKTANNVISVVPYPNEVEIKCGSFNAAGADFFIYEGVDAASTSVIVNLAESLTTISGQESAITDANSGKGFIFVLDSEMPAEAYSIMDSIRLA